MNAVYITRDNCCGLLKMTSGFRDGLPAAVEQLSSRLKLYMQVSHISLFTFFRKVQRKAPVRKGRVFAHIFPVLYSIFAERKQLIIRLMRKPIV
jgi:hypothetical protein